MRICLAVILLSCLAAGAPAFACGPEVRIQFSEDSPDRFRIAFTRGLKLRLVALTIDLGGSAAGAIFDDHNGLEMQSPSPSGAKMSSIRYAGTTVRLTFENFLETGTLNFHSDLDDNGLGSDPDQNHLAEGELAGASASATLIDSSGRRIDINGRFDQKNHARLGDRACV